MSFGQIANDTHERVHGLTRSNFSKPNSLVEQDPFGTIHLGRVLERMSVSDLNEQNRVYFGTVATFVAGEDIAVGRAVAVGTAIVSADGLERIDYGNRRVFHAASGNHAPEENSSHPFGVSLRSANKGQVVRVAISGFVSILYEGTGQLAIPNIGGLLSLRHDRGGVAIGYSSEARPDTRSHRTIGICVMRDETMVENATAATPYTGPVLIRLACSTQHQHADE